MKVKVILALAAATLLVVSLSIGDEQEPIHYYYAGSVEIEFPTNSATESVTPGPASCDVYSCLSFYWSLDEDQDDEIIFGYINQGDCYILVYESEVRIDPFNLRFGDFTNIDLRGQPTMSVQRDSYIVSPPNPFFTSATYAIEAEGEFSYKPDE